MSQSICYYATTNKYNIYSSMWDDFMFSEGITQEKLREYIQKEHGDRGIRELEPRLKKAWKTGSSSLNNTLEEALLCNRAGADGDTLSYAECLEIFF